MAERALSPDLQWLGVADPREYTLVAPDAPTSDRVHLVFAPTVSRSTIETLILELPQTQRLGFFDDAFPSPSDPGAYFSVEHHDGSCYVSARNHGWSTGWREVGARWAAEYLWGCRRSNMGAGECVQLEPAGSRLARLDTDSRSAFALALATRHRQIVATEPCESTP